MKKDSVYFKRQLLLLANQTAVIIFLCAMTACGCEFSPDTYIHFGVITLFCMDAAFISYKNISNSKLPDRFTFLLLLTGWQFLLLLFDGCPPVSAVSVLLLPLSLYQTLYFLQLFVFQASAYKYQKGILTFLRIICAAAVLSFFISPWLFALAYSGQCALSLAAVAFAAAVHRKRVLFLLKSRKRQLFLSLCFVLLPFLCYTAAFHNRKDYLENLLSYLITALAFVSVHTVVFRSHPSQEKYFALTWVNRAILTAAGALCTTLIACLFQIPMAALLLLLYCALLLTMVYNLLVYSQLTRSKLSGIAKDRQHFYACSLAQLMREENLKKDFSNYLHDDILQDLLSLKNLVNKADQPQIRQLMSDTLRELNSSIRAQMQTFHPTLPKSLTLKENYRNLIGSLTENHVADVCFTCNDTIFLAEPYHIIVYRIIKELVANAVRHSGASAIRAVLSLEDGIIFLEVSDNGTGFDSSVCHDASHHGLVSVQEQVHMLDGVIKVDTSPKRGTKIRVIIPMRGEDSYEYLIN